MTKEVYLELFGIKFMVEVEYEGYSVCGVVKVFAEMQGGHFVELKCDTNDFYKCLDGELQEALEDEIATDYIAKAEIQMDAAREEGRK